MGFKKNVIAVFVISLLGVLGHFVYEWTNENAVVGLFFPVNESIWEHLKLIFFPSLIFFGIEYSLSANKPKNYIPTAIKGIFYGMLSVVTLYYTITGIIGNNIDFINILIYFVSVFVTVSVRNNILNRSTEYSPSKKIFLCGLFIITALLFMFWSYNPPRFSIFIPPM